MAVSLDHEELVDSILRWIAAKHKGVNYRLFVDRVDILGAAKPKAIQGYIPDVTCELPGGGRTIVGEAKTPKDLERRHTYDQLLAYARYLSLEGGGDLVVATTWASANCAKAMLRRVCTVVDAPTVTTHVIHQLYELDFINGSVGRC